MSRALAVQRVLEPSSSGRSRGGPRPLPRARAAGNRLARLGGRAGAGAARLLSPRRGREADEGIGPAGTSTRRTTLHRVAGGDEEGGQGAPLLRLRLPSREKRSGPELAPPTLLGGQSLREETLLTSGVSKPGQSASTQGASVQMGAPVRPSRWPPRPLDPRSFLGVRLQIALRACGAPTPYSLPLRPLVVEGSILKKKRHIHPNRTSRRNIAGVSLKKSCLTNTSGRTHIP